MHYTCANIGTKKYYKKCKKFEYPQYFDKSILAEEEQEVFVDGGAFIGDTRRDKYQEEKSIAKTIQQKQDSVR